MAHRQYWIMSGHIGETVVTYIVISVVKFYL